MRRGSRKFDRTFRLSWFPEDMDSHWEFDTEYTTTRLWWDYTGEISAHCCYSLSVHVDEMSHSGRFRLIRWRSEENSQATVLTLEEAISVLRDLPAFLMESQL